MVASTADMDRSRPAQAPPLAPADAKHPLQQPRTPPYIPGPGGAGRSTHLGVLIFEAVQLVLQVLDLPVQPLHLGPGLLQGCLVLVGAPGGPQEACATGAPAGVLLQLLHSAGLAWHRRTQQSCAVILGGLLERLQSCYTGAGDLEV